MAQRTCSIEGCDRPHAARGLCGPHYAQVVKRGEIHLYPLATRTAEERFMAKIVVVPNGCWHWTGNITVKGYGMFYPGGGGPKMQSVHRWSYEHFIGPIPEGRHVDHQCHNDDHACPGGDVCLHRRCGNPAHFTLATNRENVVRALARRDRTHCANGHEMTPENTYLYSNRPVRGCRTCARIQRAAYQARKESPRSCA